MSSEMHAGVSPSVENQGGDTTPVEVVQIEAQAATFTIESLRNATSFTEAVGAYSQLIQSGRYPSEMLDSAIREQRRTNGQH